MHKRAVRQSALQHYGKPLVGSSGGISYDRCEIPIMHITNQVVRRIVHFFWPRLAERRHQEQVAARQEREDQLWKQHIEDFAKNENVTR